MRSRIALLAVAALAITACGDDDTDTEASADEAAAPADDDTEPVATTPADEATGKPSVAITGSVDELRITDVVEGTGDPAELGDTVEVYYVGVLSTDGTEFDSSFGDVSFDVTLGAGQVIPGFDEGLVGVKEGGRRQIDIPPELAYGSDGVGDLIPPDASISFVVDVVSITGPVSTTIPERADASECPATDGSEEQRREFDEYPPFCIDVDAEYSAELATNFGTITIDLDPSQAPLAVNNFVVLARYKYFDDTECHRAIPQFVIQCGDPTATGTGGPGYRFADELPDAGEYELGSIAMANAGPDTNGSQFFIISGPNGAALPPQYSLFGQVTEGLNVVAEMDAVGNPENNGVPPLDSILIETVTVTGP